jgi:hypothetical protein
MTLFFRKTAHRPPAAPCCSAARLMSCRIGNPGLPLPEPPDLQPALLSLRDTIETLSSHGDRRTGTQGSDRRRNISWTDWPPPVRTSSTHSALPSRSSTIRNRDSSPGTGKSPFTPSATTPSRPKACLRKDCRAPLSMWARADTPTSTAKK